MLRPRDLDGLIDPVDGFMRSASLGGKGQHRDLRLQRGHRLEGGGRRHGDAGQFFRRRRDHQGAIGKHHGPLMGGWQEHQEKAGDGVDVR